MRYRYLNKNKKVEAAETQTQMIDLASLIGGGGGGGESFFGIDNAAIAIFSPIDSDSAGMFVDQLMQIHFHDVTLPILIFFNSPGGEYDAGAQIVDAIKSLPVPTIGVVMGSAGSAAFYALQACTHRTMMPTSSLFWHHIICGIVEVSTPEEASQFASRYSKLNDRFFNMFKARMKNAPSNWEASFTGGNDITFEAEESLALGLVDSVTTNIADVMKLWNKLHREQTALMKAKQEKRKFKISKASLAGEPPTPKDSQSEPAPEVMDAPKSNTDNQVINQEVNETSTNKTSNIETSNRSPQSLLERIKCQVKTLIKRVRN